MAHALCWHKLVCVTAPLHSHCWCCPHITRSLWLQEQMTLPQTSCRRPGLAEAGHDAVILSPRNRNSSRPKSKAVNMFGGKEEVRVVVYWLYNITRSIHSSLGMCLSNSSQQVVVLGNKPRHLLALNCLQSSHTFSVDGRSINQLVITDLLSGTPKRGHLPPYIHAQRQRAHICIKFVCQHFPLVWAGNVVSL